MPYAYLIILIQFEIVITFRSMLLLPQNNLMLMQDPHYFDVSFFTQNHSFIQLIYVFEYFVIIMTLLGTLYGD